MADTSTAQHVTQTFHAAVPCAGDAPITIVFTTIEHMSTNPSGGFPETDTSTGTNAHFTG